MTPRGVICKCGAGKLQTQFFCDRCTAKLPAVLLTAMTITNDEDNFRGLIRRAVDILRLPRSRNHQRKKSGTHRMHWNFAR